MLAGDKNVGGGKGVGYKSVSMCSVLRRNERWWHGIYRLVDRGYISMVGGGGVTLSCCSLTI